MNGKTRDFYDACPCSNEETRHSHKWLSENIVNLHANINPPQNLPDTSCTAYAKNHTNIRKITRKSCDLRGAGTKVNGKTRDFCEMRAILNEKTRHSHKRDSANPVKMHTQVTSSSEKHVQMHTKKSAALSQAGCRLRPRPTGQREPWASALTGKREPWATALTGKKPARGLQHKEHPGHSGRGSGPKAY